MECLVDSTLMTNHLKGIQGITSGSRSMSPILSNVMLSFEENGRIESSATDLEISINTWINANVISPGKLCVNSKKLFEIFNSLPQEREVSIKKVDNSQLQITCGQYRAELPGISDEDFPALPSIDDAKYTRLDLEKKEFKKYLEIISPTIASQESRFYLTGAYMEIKDNKLVLVSTDGHRLTMVEKDIADAPEDFPDDGIIIPRKGVDEIKKSLDSAKGTDSLEIAVDYNQFSIQCGNTILYIRTIDSDFPDFRQVIPQPAPTYFWVNRNLFLEVLKRVSLFNRNRDVQLFIEKDRMRVHSGSVDVGESSDELPVDYNGDPLEIKFNAKYLIDMLQVLEEDQIKIEVTEANAPCVFRFNDVFNMVGIIMPIRS